MASQNNQTDKNKFVAGGYILSPFFFFEVIFVVDILNIRVFAIKAFRKYNFLPQENVIFLSVMILVCIGLNQKQTCRRHLQN